MNCGKTLLGKSNTSRIPALTLELALSGLFVSARSEAGLPSLQLTTYSNYPWLSQCGQVG